MTDRHVKSNRSSVDLSATIPWVNDSGEEIPAYGVVQLKTDFDTTSHASKPDGTDGLFFVSGFAPVVAGGKGESLVWNRPRPVLLEAGVAVGDEVGPVEDEWKMTPEGTGFRVLRQPDETEVGVVVQVGGGSSGGTHRIWFTIYEVECLADGDKILTVDVDEYTGGCTGPIPGEDSYGRVKVYGKCSTMKLFVAENMLDKQGSATWMHPRTGYCVPRWLVDDLCIIPTCTGDGSSGG